MWFKQLHAKERSIRTSPGREDEEGEDGNDEDEVEDDDIEDKGEDEVCE